MKICVYGAGAIGGHLLGRLAAKGVAEVSAVARGDTLAALRSHGIRVKTPRGAIAGRVAATDDPRTLGVQDAIVVAVKAPALPSIVEGLQPLIGPETGVAFVMNGIPWWYFHAHGGALNDRRIPSLDPGEALWRAIGPDRAIGGVFWPAWSPKAASAVRRHLRSAPRSGTS